jgi:hypothetical protein
MRRICIPNTRVAEKDGQNPKQVETPHQFFQHTHIYSEEASMLPCNDEPNTERPTNEPCETSVNQGIFCLSVGHFIFLNSSHAHHMACTHAHARSREEEEKMACVRTKSDGQVPLDAHPAIKLYSLYVVMFTSGTVPNVVNTSVDKNTEACFAFTKAIELAASSNFCSIAALTSDAVDAAWAWLCEVSWLETRLSTWQAPSAPQPKRDTMNRHAQVTTNWTDAVASAIESNRNETTMQCAPSCRRRQ